MIKPRILAALSDGEEALASFPSLYDLQIARSGAVPVEYGPRLAGEGNIRAAAFLRTVGLSISARSMGGNLSYQARENHADRPFKTMDLVECGVFIQNEMWIRIIRRSGCMDRNLMRSACPLKYMASRTILHSFFCCSRRKGNVTLYSAK